MAVMVNSKTDWLALMKIGDIGRTYNFRLTEIVPGNWQLLVLSQDKPRLRLAGFLTADAARESADSVMALFGLKRLG